MPLLKDDELRVVMFAVRHIYGWTDTLAKRMAQLSLTAFERGARGSRGCGLSRPAIVAALQGLEQYRILRCVGENARGRYWALAESDADMDWDGLEERRAETDAKNRRKTAAASQTVRTRKPEQAGTSHVPGVRPTYQPDGTTHVPEKGYVPRTTGTADVPTASTTHVPPAGTTDVHIETHVLKPTSDDDPSDTPEKNIKQTTSSFPPEDVREVLSELQSLGLSAPLRRQVLQEGTERALALALHAQGEGRNPAGLLISMLRQGSDPAPKYVELARIKLQPPAPLPSQVTTSPTPQREPVGLDEHPGGGALSVRDLWHALLGQLELQLNRATFDTWVRGTVAERYEDGVLWVRPRHLYAREWLEKHLQHLLDESLSRLAGVPVTVRFLGEAAAQAAGR
ncbi:DnaA N-terminal domain-containing protein [Aggregatilinea lenta]|uniref:DnaA N-terminal domain-containing protein n=1 Tax=Aggregatilinea lenta TaxID=913108 RepID=UPI0013C36215|nr:DnaA N-terminal domain-containing protein [Aggregatilinea lenta]